jgi:hypothetical protein
MNFSLDEIHRLENTVYDLLVVWVECRQTAGLPNNCMATSSSLYNQFSLQSTPADLVLISCRGQTGIQSTHSWMR